MTRSVFSQEYDLFRLLLIQAREAAGLTQVELSERLEMPRTFVWKYENGERRLDIVEFLRIAQALQVDPHEVIDRLLSLSTLP